MTAVRPTGPRDEPMLAAVRGLPDQIDATWAERTTLRLPWSRERFDHVAVLGMGGSAIGGDLVANVLVDRLRVPVVVVRDDRLPRWVSTRTLVIGISVSGETAETLAAWSAAAERGCAAVAITRGGRLARAARAAGAPVIVLPAGGPPRAALGHTFAWCAAVLEHVGLVDGVGALLAESTAAMRQLVALDAAAAVERHVGADVRTAVKSADESAGETAFVFDVEAGVEADAGGAPRADAGSPHGPGSTAPPKPTPAVIARRMDGAVPVVYVPAAIEAVGRRWKAQLNENAKVAAGYDCVPELHHNSVVPYAPLAPGAPAPALHPTLLWPAGNAAMALTAQLLDDYGLPYSAVHAPPDLAPMAQGLWLVQFGDLVSVRLAERRGVDPMPIHAIDRMKALRSMGTL